jgi:DNA-binding transcriptional regulator YiaG
MAKKNRIEVTSENFGKLLIQGIEEAVAIKEGRTKPARVNRRKITSRKAEVSPPPRYNPGHILKVRRSLGVSQPVFASMLNVSRSTVRAWEQGSREPEGATRRLLEVAAKHPKVLAEAVGMKTGK